MKIYLKHPKTGRRFEIVKIDKERGKVTLKGAHATFVEDWKPEQFKKDGYVLEKGELEDAEQ